ncbi:MAG: hypothetical protein EA380_01945 [Phycisphaeraceae bacterium]|nr:MAG: hypothetical protein EA380_01945 [Phycisphaeraceae bacterium]
MRRFGLIGTSVCLLAFLGGCAATQTPSASIQAQLDADRQYAQTGVLTLAAGDNLGRQIWAQDIYLATGRFPSEDMLTTVVIVEE